MFSFLRKKKTKVYDLEKRKEYMRKYYLKNRKKLNEYSKNYQRKRK